MVARMDVKFQPNGNWDRTFRSPGGMVGRHLRREARKVVLVAKQKVAVDKSGPHPGMLKRSIKAGGPALTNLRDLYIDVTAHAPYALWNHEGFPPHVILPKKKKILYWVDPVSGGTFARKTNHPGYVGNPFLRDALIAVIGGAVP